MKVNIIRKPTFYELIPQQEIIIEKELMLDKDLFFKFIRKPLDDYDFIKENIDIMYVDNDEVWHVVLVRSQDSNFGVLVQSEGYSYARFATVVKNLVLEPYHSK
ncbi:MAG: hypothetical protein ACOX5E_05805 [Bacilli bacterium]|jgi:hypothetical protein|nr:hypothetical protein [Acholeplasmataceae bacterium]